MEKNLNQAPSGLSKEEELNKKLKDSRRLLVKLVKDNPENLDKVDPYINGFIDDIKAMLDEGKISEAKYWEQIVELYCELYISEQEKLVEQGLGEEEARGKNRWAIPTENILSEAGVQTLYRAKREEGVGPEEIDVEIKQLR